ncbi:MAG: endonuclease/exonuclease/phosphatase family protein [Bacteroidales bacterium]|nr:endonuclease/exonuclease/phosphatase family protein [Bacteroidales bacterium]
MKKSLSILCLAVLLLTSCTSTQLTFMSFNIRNSSAWGEDGDNDWAHRRQAVANMIMLESPDALGMQEMLPDQLAYLDSALAPQYDRIGVGRDDGKEEGENMCIYYKRDRLSLLSWSTRWLSATPDSVSFGWDAACRRTVTEATFIDKRTQQPIAYLNTHLDHVGPAARRNSIRLLCQIAREYACPVVLGGDMNSDINDTIFTPLSETGLMPARNLCNAEYRTTFTGYGKYPATVIDHFFVRNLKVKSFRTLDGNYGVPYISDHHPILMKLKSN